MFCEYISCITNIIGREKLPNLTLNNNPIKYNIANKIFMDFIKGFKKHLDSKK